MLHIKHKLQLDFPHVTFTPTQNLQLSPVTDDDDDLLDELAYQQAEENMTLDETIDPNQLADFWSGVSDDLKNDPDWFDFAED